MESKQLMLIMSSNKLRPIFFLKENSQQRFTITFRTSATLKGCRHKNTEHTGARAMPYVAVVYEILVYIQNENKDDVCSIYKEDMICTRARIYTRKCLTFMAFFTALMPLYIHNGCWPCYKTIFVSASNQLLQQRKS